MSASDPGSQQNLKAEQKIAAKEARRLKSRTEAKHRIWFGLGTFGVIGWSIAAPTVLGAALGVWIDDETDSQRSWTLTLMLTGLFLGCVNVWRWLQQEGREQ